MRVIRAGLPALIGAVLLGLGGSPILADLLGGDPARLVYAVRNGFIPIAIGIGLLLVAVALYRQSRLGYLLALVVATLFAIAGLGVILIESSFLNSEEFGASFALPIIAIGAAWTVVWIVYAWRLALARSTFAAAWQPGDRPLAVGLAVLVAASIGLNFALDALASSAIAATEGQQLQAQSLVGGTTLAVEVNDQTVDPSGATVEHLMLTLTVNAAVKYALFNRPTLCLTDLATYQDPAYKSGNVCWGGDGTPITVMDDIGTPGLAEGSTGIAVDLSRGASRCAFAAGVWNAELTLVPRTGAGAPDGYTIRTTFEVQRATDETAAPPSATGQEPSSCMASLVSK